MSEFANPPIEAPIEELELGILAAVKAGDEVLDVYSKEFSTQTKKDDSPITEADIKSSKIINEVLRRSKHMVLSEEEKDNLQRLEEDTIWIVDPLDGTTDFINRTGEFTIMISLVKEKKPVLGIIYWPTEKTMYLAQKGQGAFRYNNKDSWKKIQVSDNSEITQCKVVGSRHHLSEEEKSLIERLGITNFTSIGSSLKVGKVSSGEADAYITTTNKMKEWDSCASHCIVTEAGGKITDMLGNEITYNNELVNHKNGILVTNGLIHDIIIDEYKKLKEIF